MTNEQGSFCFIHAADLHLDTPFKGLHGLAPSVAAALREASLDAFDAIVDLALSSRAAFVLFAGDIYDGAERGLRAQLRFRDGLARLSSAGIQSFIVHGNHDPVTTGWSALSKWPDLVTVFPHDSLEVVPVKRDGKVVATVQGLSYATAATTENLAKRFRRPAGDGFHIGLLHCNVEGSPGDHDNYSPCTLTDLLETGLDYLALGHVHQRRVLAGSPGNVGQFVVYPGNTQARMAKWTEQEPKGAYLVSVAHGIVEELEFVPCDKVRFVEFECDICDLDELGDLDDALANEGMRLLNEQDGRSIVVRARLVGRGRLHGELARRGVGDALLERLREEQVDRQPFIWWDGIADATGAELDLSEIKGRGDFAADLLELSELLGFDDEKGRELVEEVAAGAPKALATSLDELIRQDLELEHLLARATTLALDLLGLEQR